MVTSHCTARVTPRRVTNSPKAPPGKMLMDWCDYPHTFTQECESGSNLLLLLLVIEQIEIVELSGSFSVLLLLHILLKIVYNSILNITSTKSVSRNNFIKISRKIKQILIYKLVSRQIFVQFRISQSAINIRILLSQKCGQISTREIIIM